MKRSLLLLCALSLVFGLQARKRQNFDKGWRFILADSANMARVNYNDAHWRLLDLPHDWAIEGDFMAGNPSGASGGALPGGVGWYRKHFRVDNPMLYFVEFDGVYMNATIYVNGERVYNRPYGYSSFQCDITRYLRMGDNVIAVRVDNSDQPNSRWYSGCGIYRHVWFSEADPVHVKPWGVHVTADAKKGRIKVKVDVQGRGYSVRNYVYDNNGNEVGLRIRNPRLWSPDRPYCYRVRTVVTHHGQVVDDIWTVTAFRDFRFDAKTGFWLNGKNIKINGVCEHHDLGCLGAALHEDALHRKLVKLKEMGVNAIRSSHNPPAPELLNMCDTMGFIVMDESFDMWRRRKTENDYARFFDKWHEQDLTDMVLRDRNHPCILMWSIGNEVLEQWSSADADNLSAEEANLILNAGHDTSKQAKDTRRSPNTALAEHLADIIRQYDDTRPITAGCNEPSPANHLFKGNALDIIGFNYHHQDIKDVPRNFPGRPFIMTESVSALQTNGYYKMPSDHIYKAPQEWWLPYTDPTFMCSAYDNMHASWSSTHEQTWDVVKNTPYVSGQFIWTGFDYLGEPTPYGFPARSSYFGIIDLAGQPKDIYYMYQSEWTQKPVLHLFPHWNWLEGQEIDMWCYYNNADEVELFVNGKSQGTRRKQPSAPVLSSTTSSGSSASTSASSASSSSSASTSVGSAAGTSATPYHVSWRVKYASGEVKVVARKNGRIVREQSLYTAEQPDRILLTVDYRGSDLTFIQAEVVDRYGHRCPWAENQLFFTTDGSAQVIATDNGCQTSMERFTSPNRKAFFGRCIAVVKGKGTVYARSYGISPGAIKL